MDIVVFVVGMIKIVMDLISVVLIVFVVIFFFVLSVMIGIIIYILVLEWIKEIGVFCFIGVRKKDILCVFNVEVILIGLFVGFLGVIIIYLFVFIVNIFLVELIGND